MPRVELKKRVDKRPPHNWWVKEWAGFGFPGVILYTFSSYPLYVLSKITP